MMSANCTDNPAWHQGEEHINKLFLELYIFSVNEDLICRLISDELFPFLSHAVCAEFLLVVAVKIVNSTRHCLSSEKLSGALSKQTLV